MFARRVAWDLSRNPLAEAVLARRARGAEVVDLTDANPTRAGLLAGGEALARVLADVARDADTRRYEPDPRGPCAAREAIARYHARGGPAIDPDCVLLTAGTSEGYAHLFRLLADPGERVLVPRPGYPLFDFLAGLEGVATGSYPLVRRGAGFRIDGGALAREAARPGVRALLAVHAHNPTGAFVHPDDAHALRALCREHGQALVSDEVFAESALEPAPPGTRLASLYDSQGDASLHFVLSGASKLLALPQLKLSWIVVGGARALRDEAASRLEAIADTYLSVSPVLAACLPALLDARPAIEAQLRARVRANRDALAKLVAAVPGAELLPVEGGFTAILEFAGRDGAAPDEEALALACVERAGVLAHPGFFFDFEDDGRARLVVSLLAEPERFAVAARALLGVAAEACAS
ncbi:MAG TPA: pyridoxal phosphate-dependent aminotransferase [Myxococcota bacterium]|nr:pyridoxal phosphate-dependent aminotransferase [Myxococcota bacterium]